MSDYTLLHRDDLDDAAAEWGMGEFQEARFATRQLSSDQLGFAWHRVKPGKRSPIAHRHRDQDELYVVVGGSGHAKVGEELVELRAGHLLCVPAATWRGFEAGDDGLELLAFGAPVVDGDTPDKGELSDTHWDD